MTETNLIKDLQDEVAYLRSLLDANGIPYDYEEFLAGQVEETDFAAEMVPLQITTETAKFFFSMFHGRVDVYAKRSKDKGYFPQCENFWKWDMSQKRRCEDEVFRVPFKSIFQTEFPDPNAPYARRERGLHRCDRDLCDVEG